MDRYVIRGVKKLFSLTRTKIRLAEEAGTKITKPSPLPLVLFFSGVEVRLVSEAKEIVGKLKENVNFENSHEVGKCVAQLIDIIEGVKWKFEPEEMKVLLDKEKLINLENETESNKAALTILMGGEWESYEINYPSIYVGFTPPDGVLHLGRVPSTLSFFLSYALQSNYFSSAGKLRNVEVRIRKRTLLWNALAFSFEQLGALIVERE